MRKQEFTNALSNALTGVRVSAELRRRTLDASCEKETVVVKKRLSWAALTALLAVMACAAALAAASRAGMFDFMARYAEVPEDAASYLQANAAQAENELVSACVRELYYDGRLSRMTVDVTPKNKEMLLISMDSCLGDPCGDLYALTREETETDGRSILAYAQANGYAQISHVSVLERAEEGRQPTTCAGDAMLADDGTLTLFWEAQFQDYQAERSVKLLLAVTPFEQPYTKDSRMLQEQRTVLEMPLALNAANHARATDAARVYVSDEPMLFSAAGVRVDAMRVEVTATELHTLIDYTVIDREAYRATDDGLFFELIDPDSQETDYPMQRLKGGLSGAGGVRPLDETEHLADATRFRQEDTLALKELRQSYVIRAFNCWNGERYETRTAEMKAAE